MCWPNASLGPGEGKVAFSAVDSSWMCDHEHLGCGIQSSRNGGGELGLLMLGTLSVRAGRRTCKVRPAKEGDLYPSYPSFREGEAHASCNTVVVNRSLILNC